jgi:hypothetical protein
VGDNVAHQDDPGNGHNGLLANGRVVEAYAPGLTGFTANCTHSEFLIAANRRTPELFGDGTQIIRMQQRVGNYQGGILFILYLGNAQSNAIAGLGTSGVEFGDKTGGLKKPTPPTAIDAS